MFILPRCAPPRALRDSGAILFFRKTQRARYGAVSGRSGHSAAQRLGPRGDIGGAAILGNLAGPRSIRFRGAGATPRQRPRQFESAYKRQPFAALAGLSGSARTVENAYADAFTMGGAG